MRKIRNTALALGLVAGGSYLLYRYGLSDSAKKNLRKAVSSVKEVSEQIVSAVEAAQGHVVADDDQPLANAQTTRQQWENLGY